MSLSVLECLLGTTADVPFRLRVRDLVSAPFNLALVCSSLGPGEQSWASVPCSGTQLDQIDNEPGWIVRGKVSPALEGCIDLAGLAGTIEHSSFLGSGEVSGGPCALRE